MNALASLAANNVTAKIIVATATRARMTATTRIPPIALSWVDDIVGGTANTPENSGAAPGSHTRARWRASERRR
jgi:hypothetical protein